MSVRHRPLPRLLQLFGGVTLFGASIALMVRAGLGLSPWDVLHHGLQHRLHLSFGTLMALTSALVLLIWIPLRQRPGIGTFVNVVVIAISTDVFIVLLPRPDWLPWQLAMLFAGVALNGLATAIYVGARLGPGPRDGLMTGLHAQTGWSVRAVRTSLEITVLAVGWLLGGTAGLGTAVFALGIGPVTQLFLPLCTVGRAERR